MIAPSRAFRAAVLNCCSDLVLDGMNETTLLLYLFWLFGCFKLHNPALRKSLQETQAEHDLRGYAWPHPLRKQRGRSKSVDLMHSRLAPAPLSSRILANVLFRDFNSSDAWEHHGAGAVLEHVLTKPDVTSATRLDMLATGLGLAMSAHGATGQGLFALGYDCRTDSKCERKGWCGSESILGPVAQTLYTRLGQYAAAADALAEMLSDESLPTLSIRNWLVGAEGFRGKRGYHPKWIYDDLANNGFPRLKVLCVVGPATQTLLDEMFKGLHLPHDQALAVLCDIVNGLCTRPSSPMFKAAKACMQAANVCELEKCEVQVTCCSFERWRHMDTPQRSGVLAQLGKSHVVQCFCHGVSGCAPLRAGLPSPAALAGSRFVDTAPRLVVLQSLQVRLGSLHTGALSVRRCPACSAVGSFNGHWVASSGSERTGQNLQCSEPECKVRYKAHIAVAGAIQHLFPCPSCRHVGKLTGTTWDNMRCFGCHARVNLSGASPHKDWFKSWRCAPTASLRKGGQNFRRTQRRIRTRICKSRATVRPRKRGSRE